MGNIALSTKYPARDKIFGIKDAENARKVFQKQNELLIINGRTPMNIQKLTLEEERGIDHFLKIREPKEWEKIEEIKNILDEKLLNFLDWRTCFMERDANYRALKWIRELQKKGADFSVLFPILEEDFGSGILDDLASISEKRGITLQEYFQACLGSHGASNDEMRNSQE